MRRPKLQTGREHDDESDRKSRNKKEQGCPDRGKSAGNHGAGGGGGIRQV